MNIAILSRAEALYSTQSLLKAGRVQNHQMEVLDPAFCNLMIENKNVVLQYHDEIIDNIDAIIPRIGNSFTYQGTSVVRHFEAMGVYTTASSKGILQSRDKWTCFQHLAKMGLPIPKTTLAPLHYLPDFLKDFGEGKVILKLTEGTHGQGVILCDNYQNALATAETLQSTKSIFVIQEYIEESRGEDIRVIVVDGQVVAAMKRKSKAGDFRSNLHRGGSAIALRLPQETKKIAIQAAKTLGLTVCGIDILQSNRGPLILEVNSTPGLEGIENATKINVAASIIRCIERNKNK